MDAIIIDSAYIYGRLNNQSSISPRHCKLATTKLEPDSIDFIEIIGIYGGQLKKTTNNENK